MINDWDRYFMSMVYLVAMKSKDQSTHIGAVIVGPDNEIRSTGYNSFVRGINDNIPERQERPEKYFWFEHAERNSILNASRFGTPLKGCKMYTNGIPCADCGRAVIQAGLSEVIVHKQWSNICTQKWEESAIRSSIMFKECGVIVREYDGPLIITIDGFRAGEIVTFTGK